MLTAIMGMPSLLRKVFLVDLLQGLKITFRYQDPKEIYTEQYPLERPQVAERYRGAPRLNVNPDTDETMCIACDLCALACPENLIVVSSARNEKTRRKELTDFTYDLSRCMFCGLAKTPAPSTPSNSPRTSSWPAIPAKAGSGTARRWKKGRSRRSIRNSDCSLPISPDCHPEEASRPRSGRLPTQDRCNWSASAGLSANCIGPSDRKQRGPQDDKDVGCARHLITYQLFRQEIHGRNQNEDEERGIDRHVSQRDRSQVESRCPGAFAVDAFVMFAHRRVVAALADQFQTQNNNIRSST